MGSPERAAGSEQQLGGRVPVEAELRADLIVGQALVLAQGEGCSLGGRQRQQRPQHIGPRLALREYLLGLEALRGGEGSGDRLH